MENGKVVQKASDKVCPGCKGRGGKHWNLACPWFKDDVDRLLAKQKREKHGKR